MSPTFVAALFAALLMIVFWRVVLVGAVAVLLAAVLIGLGAMPDESQPGAGAADSLVQDTDAPQSRLVADPGE